MSSKELELVTFNGKLAAYCFSLDRASNARGFKPEKAEQYRALMANGQWGQPSTSQPIRFDENGELANGQHRMAAMCTQAHRKYDFYVENMPRDVRMLSKKVRS